MTDSTPRPSFLQAPGSKPSSPSPSLHHSPSPAHRLGHVHPPRRPRPSHRHHPRHAAAQPGRSDDDTPRTHTALALSAPASTAGMTDASNRPRPSFVVRAVAQSSSSETTASDGLPLRPSLSIHAFARAASGSLPRTASRRLSSAGNSSAPPSGQSSLKTTLPSGSSAFPSLSSSVRNTTSSAFRGNSSTPAPSSTLSTTSTEVQSIFLSGAHFFSFSTPATTTQVLFAPLPPPPPSPTSPTNSIDIIGGAARTTDLDQYQPSPSSKPDPGNSGPADLSPEERRVIGGVVGGLAGAAFVALLLLLALKYKRRSMARAALSSSSPSSSTSPAALTRSPGLADEAPRMMAEVSGLSAVTAALNNLMGRGSPVPRPMTVEGAEKGFYRVSGRKLPPVLDAGGDGYTDPRRIPTNGSLDYHQISQAFGPDSHGPGHLALGAPMRPISGVLVMRSGPARTPVTENPFNDPPASPATLDTMDRDSEPDEDVQAPRTKFQEHI